MIAAMRLKTPFAIALAILAIAVSSIAGAFVFEAFGYAPCELCLKERIPYYAAIPVAGLALLFSVRGPKTLLRAGFVVLVADLRGERGFGRLSRWGGVGILAGAKCVHRRA